MARELVYKFKKTLEQTNSYSLNLADDLGSGHAGFTTFEQLNSYTSIQAAVWGQPDDSPLYLFRPEVLAKRVEMFKQHFPGRVLYAVKANHNPCVLDFLGKCGIDAFDVASIDEVALVRTICPEAEVFFMNPVKSPSSIRQAYYQFGVRNFVLDANWELDKILRETDFARDLCLFVRVAVCNKKASLNLSNKFGVAVEEAPILLEKVARCAQKVGLAFHVGSQCSDPAAHRNAFDEVRYILNNISFPLAALDIGGGFAANYGQKHSHPVNDYLQDIRNDCRLFSSNHLELLSEPGRVMVADACSLVLKIIGRKGDSLYLTDGIYGGLFENTADGIQFPVRPFALDTNKKWSKKITSFSVWGPSCDGYDGLGSIQFTLPDNVEIGDYIEFGHAGAYSEVFRSNFNGFYRFNQACFKSEPF